MTASHGGAQPLTPGPPPGPDLPQAQGGGGLGEAGRGDVEGKLQLVQVTQVCPRWALLSPQEL